MGQYVVSVHKGSFESQSLTSLTFFLEVGENSYTAAEVAKSFKDVMDECVQFRDKEIERYYAEVQNPHFKPKPIEASELFDSLFEQNIDQAGEIYDVFEESGWNFDPSKAKVTKFVSIVNMDYLLKNWDKEHPKLMSCELEVENE